jgi:hypothetical protein
VAVGGLVLGVINTWRAQRYRPFFVVTGPDGERVLTATNRTGEDVIAFQAQYIGLTSTEAPDYNAAVIAPDETVCFRVEHFPSSEDTARYEIWWQRSRTEKHYRQVIAPRDDRSFLTRMRQAVGEARKVSRRRALQGRRAR